MKPAVRYLVLFGLAFAWGVASPADLSAGSTGCLRCHEGIERISDMADMADLSCEDCHRGDPKGRTEEAAHKGMYANPSDLRVADRTCGQCHEEDVENVKRSLHATMAGMISGTRYDWAAQETRNAVYATYDVEARTPDIPKGTFRSLQRLPSYDPSKPEGPTNSPADDYLRDQCLRSHLWSQGARQDGDYRASGCAACHVVYSDAGTYEGGDKAIDRKRKGRPKLHRLTVKIPVNQCLHCHNRGGRTGVSYVGMMESDGYGSPWGTEAGTPGGKKLHGKFYNYLNPDVHYRKGMACIDCHTKRDLHGDGNLYGKKEQAVEIRCESCHGTADAESAMKTSRGSVLDNLKKTGADIVLVSRMDGGERIVPQGKDVAAKGSDSAKTAMGIPAHMEKMECYACHARWAPQCYGCHAQQDLATRSGDWINTQAGDDPSKGGTTEAKQQTTFKWRETRSYLRWESPVLGINAKGKVSPFIPGCQVIFTQIGPDGSATVHNKVYTTSDGTSGIATNPIQPHTVTKEARTCEDCHANRKAVGLGGGTYDSRANGVDVPFELERIVDEEGKQIQATNHDGARPFNKEEQARILRVGVCVSCHKKQTDPAAWKRITDATGFARTDAMHKQILETIFEAGTRP